MLAIDWIWTLCSVITVLGFAAWTWQAAGDVRDMAAAPDLPMLRSIARHASTQPSSPE